MEKSQLFLEISTIRARIRLGQITALVLLACAMIAWVTHIDAAVFRAIESRARIRDLHPLFQAYSNWGPALFYLPFVGALAYGLVRKQTDWRALGLAYLLAQLIGPVLAVHGIKLATGVARPQSGAVEHALFQVADFTQRLHSAFPSSHSADVAVGALFAWAQLRHRTAIALALLAALALAASRVLLGRHALSDVLAGLAVGMLSAAWVIGHYLLPRWARSNTAGSHP